MFDPNKHYRFRNGDKAEIFATDLSGDYPIGVIRTSENGRREVLIRTKDGKVYTHQGHDELLDLVNIPVKRRGWIAISNEPHGDGAFSTSRVEDTKEKAEVFAIAADFDATIIPIEWEVK